MCLQVQKLLGKGSYGIVYRVKRKSDGVVYALKEADVRKMSPVERMDAVNEIRLLASVKHQNVVRYHEAFLDGERGQLPGVLAVLQCWGAWPPYKCPCLAMPHPRWTYSYCWCSGAHVTQIPAPPAGNLLCIVMEYAPNGDLSRFIKKGNELKRAFPEEIIWKYFVQICQGLHALHSNKIIHR